MQLKIKHAVRPKALLASLICATMTVALAACGTGSGAQESERDTLVVGGNEEPPTLDVQKSDSNGLTLATWSINEALVDFDKNGEMRPVLAAELPQIDPADSNVWTIKLREGVTFTDGTPFNAEAVKYNVERIVDPDYASDLAGNFSTVKSVEVVDDYTVNLITNEPDAILPRKLRVLRILSPEAAEGGSNDQHPVGTGPYTFEKWRKGIDLTLKANRDYWGDPKPTIDNIEIRFIPDPNTRLAALQSGEIDVDVAPSIDRLNSLVADGEFKTLEIQGGSSGITFLPGIVHPYSDINFRKALNFAINREEIVQSLFDGRFLPQTGNLMAKGTEGYVPSLEGTYTYDPNKAREYLDKVTLPDGFEIELVTSSIYLSAREVAGALASYWEAVGLKVKIRVVEIGEYLDLLFKDRGNVVLFGTSSNETGTIMRQVDAYYRRGAAGNVLDEQSQKLLDPLIDNATVAFDPAERERALTNLSTAISEQALPLFTHHQVDFAGVVADLNYEAGFGGFQRISFNFMAFDD